MGFHRDSMGTTTMGNFMGISSSGWHWNMPLAHGAYDGYASAAGALAVSAGPMNPAIGRPTPVMGVSIIMGVISPIAIVFLNITKALGWVGGIWLRKYPNVDFCYFHGSMKRKSWILLVPLVTRKTWPRDPQVGWWKTWFSWLNSSCQTDVQPIGVLFDGTWIPHCPLDASMGCSSTQNLLGLWLTGALNT